MGTSAPAPTKPKKCKEFSLALAVLAPDDKRQISFAMERGCIDNDTPFFVLIFVLRDKIGDGFQDRVKLKVTIGPQFNDKAQKLMDAGLKDTQLDFLQGSITNAAKKLPPGTTADPATEKKVAAILDK